MNPALRRPLLLLAVASSFACEAEDAARPPADPAEEGLLRLELPNGARPADLRLFLDDGVTIRAIDCGAAPEGDGTFACDPAGVRLVAGAAMPAHLSVVAKARGQATLEAAFTPPPSGAIGAAHFEPLAAFEATADYATGLAGDDPQPFLDLGWHGTDALGEAVVVKFYLQPGPPVALWLQQTALHPLHFDFVRGVLGRALTLAEFEAQTYTGLDRTGFAGSLVLHPALVLDAPDGRLQAPLSVEFFPTDDLTPAQARDVLLRLEERLDFARSDGLEHALAWVPAGSAQQDALGPAELRSFAAAGLRVLRREALYAGITEQRLNAGVAFGTLRLVQPEALATSPVSFRDVLVLPRLPNALPIVGGTITGELQTPLAHVNVAARARGTPNLALLGAASDPRITALLNRLVRFEVTAAGFTLEEARLAEAEAFWRERADRPRYVPDADLTLDGLPLLSELSFSDAASVGVKAANVAELSHLLGENAPSGFAVPFAAYERFLQTGTVAPAACADAELDCLSEGRTAALCETARTICEPAALAGEPLVALVARVQQDEGAATDTALREAALDALRHVLRHTALAPAEAAALDARVSELFGTAPVRLRSSTNAEDLEGFTGAGLYASTTAYGAGRDAASDEIRKVWASAFTFRGVEERAFWNVEESAVKVGVLVHEAFPDEQVNGVLITQNVGHPAVRGFYVNAQLGEESVTNPLDGALPEVFSIVPGPEGVQVVRERFSSLSPAASLLTAAELATLTQAAARIHAHFAALYGRDPAEVAFDLEWKLHGPERRLIVKQCRPYALDGP